MHIAPPVPVVAQPANRFKVSEDAAELYALLDPQATEQWQPFTDSKPNNNTRQLLHELGSQKLLASYTMPATNIHWFSTWQNRFPEHDLQQRLLKTHAVSRFVYHYADWTQFSFDYFGMVLRNIGVNTEAMYQINKSYLTAVKLGLLESRNHGTQVRATEQAHNWNTTRHHCSEQTADRIGAQGLFKKPNED